MMDNLHHENVVVNTSIGIRFWRSEVSTRGYVPFHWHSSIELNYVPKGRLDYTINGQTVTVTKNQFIVIPSGVVHAVANQPNIGYVFQIPLRVIEPYIDHPERVSFINDHSTEPLSVAALAREFGYNPNYLSRRFKQQVGISLIHYIYLVKLNHLYNDLVNTDTDIRQLFQKNGLTNPRTARKFFREMFGRLPSEVRQQKNSTRPTEKQP